MSAPQRRVLRMPPHCILGLRTVPCTPSRSCDECALTTYSFMPGPSHSDKSHSPGNSQGQRLHLQARSTVSCGCTHASGRLDCCLINWPKESLAGPEKSTTESGQGPQARAGGPGGCPTSSISRGSLQRPKKDNFCSWLPQNSPSICQGTARSTQRIKDEQK